MQWPKGAFITYEIIPVSELHSGDYIVTPMYENAMAFTQVSMVLPWNFAGSVQVAGQFVQYGPATYTYRDPELPEPVFEPAHPFYVIYTSTETVRVVR